MVIEGSRVRQVVAGLLCAYLGILVFMVVVPWGDIPTRVLSGAARAADRLGAPAVLLEPTRFEFIANVLVVVPVVAAVSWLVPKVRWTEWTAYGFVASISVEALQALVVTGRSATYSDVVANTAGALAGAVVGLLVRRVARRPDRAG